MIRNRSDVSTTMRLKNISHYTYFHVIPGDITDYYSMIKFLDKAQPDVIYHLASQSFVPTSMNNPLDTYDVTLNGTLYLLEATRNVCPKARFVFAGSSEEYGAQFDTVEDYINYSDKFGYCFPEPIRYPETPLNEESILRPQSPYAVAKVASDFACKNYAQTYGLNTVVARPFNIEGAGRGHHFVTASIVRQLVEIKYGERKELRIGNTEAKRDWSHVDDIVEGYTILGLDDRVRMGETYVMGSGEQHSIDDFIDLAMLEMSKDDDVLGCTVIRDPSLMRKTDVNNLLADPTKIKNIGWTPTRTVSDIITDLIHYYMVKENRSNVLII